MASKDINKLIRKYLTASINQNELNQLQEWLNEDQKHHDMLRDLKKIWEEPSEEPELINSGELIDKMWSAGVEKADKRGLERKWFNQGYFVKVAAAVLLILSATIIIYKFTEIPSEQNSVAENVVKANPSGQKMKIYLTDGSIAWLNADSRITYPRHFNDSVRAIQLTGEAYFEVAKDPSKPFVVISSALSVQALGTSFNVNAYPDQSHTQVSLITGSVKVEMANDSRSVILSPGKQINYDRNSEEFVESAFDPEEAIGWKEGILIFKQAGYEDVVRRLERWFAIKIYTQGVPPDDWQLTAHYEDENLQNILKNLEFGKRFGYELNQEVLTIKF